MFLGHHPPPPRPGPAWPLMEINDGRCWGGTAIPTPRAAEMGSPGVPPLAAGPQAVMPWAAESHGCFEVQLRGADIGAPQPQPGGGGTEGTGPPCCGESVATSNPNSAARSSRILSQHPSPPSLPRTSVIKPGLAPSPAPAVRSSRCVCDIPASPWQRDVMSSARGCDLTAGGE